METFSGLSSGFAEFFGTFSGICDKIAGDIGDLCGRYKSLLTGEKMELLLLYYSIMVACYFIAAKLRDKKERLDVAVNNGLTAIMYIIVFLMGIRMGANEEVTANLGTIGVQSVIITVLTIALSMICVSIMRKVMKLDKHGDKTTAIADKRTELTEAKGSFAGKTISEKGISARVSAERAIAEKDIAEENLKAKENLKTTLYIAIDVALAMLAGYFVIRQNFAESYGAFDSATSTAIILGLCCLVGFVGFSLGLDGTVVSRLKETGIKVILVPMMLLLGTTLAGVIFSLITDFSMKEALAICWGFGWYTYAPGVIAEAGYVIASAVSFLHNVIRETAGIVGIPLFAQKFGYLEATTVPGIASMDLCMPIIERSCRQDTIVYGLCNGLLASLVCSLMVPIIIAI